MKTKAILLIISAIILVTLLTTSCTALSRPVSDTKNKVTTIENDSETTPVSTDDKKIDVTGGISIRTDGANIKVDSFGIQVDTTDKETEVEIVDDIENLYSYQLNYSNGTAQLNIIPTPMAENLYDNYEKMKAEGRNHLPIMIREYAATNMVYFDYDTDSSIVWNKDTGSVTIARTDIEEREAFKEKQHK